MNNRRTQQTEKVTFISKTNLANLTFRDNKFYYRESVSHTEKEVLPTLSHDIMTHKKINDKMKDTYFCYDNNFQLVGILSKPNRSIGPQQYDGYMVFKERNLSDMLTRTTDPNLQELLLKAKDDAKELFSQVIERTPRTYKPIISSQKLRTSTLNTQSMITTPQIRDASFTYFSLLLAFDTLRLTNMDDSDGVQYFKDTANDTLKSLFPFGISTSNDYARLLSFIPDDVDNTLLNKLKQMLPSMNDWWLDILINAVEFKIQHKTFVPVPFYNSATPTSPTFFNQQKNVSIPHKNNPADTIDMTYQSKNEYDLPENLIDIFNKSGQFDEYTQAAKKTKSS